MSPPDRSTDGKRIQARFRGRTTKEQVAAFNSQVGNPDWVPGKGRYLLALYQTFQRRGIDISVIETGNSMNLDHHVTLHSTRCRLVRVVDDTRQSPKETEPRIRWFQVRRRRAG